MSDYSIFGTIYRGGDPTLNQVLSRAYRQRERPLCMCVDNGAMMYIAKIGERYVIKRMPLSGISHSPTCESYEPPPEVSGLGEVMGQAIQVDLGTGNIALKLDFSLAKIGSRTPPEPSGALADTVKTDAKRLTLRSMLHYLWDEAGLSKWSPRMEGRRSWAVVHKYLTQAALGKFVKGAALGEAMFVPEPYFLDKAGEIASRRNAIFARLKTSGTNGRKLMMVVGEVKQITEGRYGHKLILKQLPDCPFMMDEAILKRMAKRFEIELTLWGRIETSHLTTIATFGVGPAGVPVIEEMSLMLTTGNWIPFADLREKELVDALTNEARHFVKCLRYNMADDRPLAAVVLTDTQPVPTALYIDDGDPTDSDAGQHADTVEELHTSTSLASWTWATGAGSPPEFPASARRDSANARTYGH